MSDFTPELTAQLIEKEELISELTDRLELAAEQLDRFQRTVGDRGRFNVPSAGPPAELIERQQHLCEDMEAAVARWEDLECPATMGRIEMKLDELRDLIVHQRGATPGREWSQPASSPVSRYGQDEGYGQNEESYADPAGSSWAQLKSSLLGDSESGEIQQPSGHFDEKTSKANTTEIAHSHWNSTTDIGPLSDTPLPKLPPIDLATAGRTELREAVEQRDALLVDVMARLRIAEGRTRPAGDWKSLAEVPGELRARLESLEGRLEEALRTSEVELSLERARLAREEAKLRNLEQTSQRALDRRELDAEYDSQPEAVTPDRQVNRRWLRMLGRRSDD